MTMGESHPWWSHFLTHIPSAGASVNSTASFVVTTICLLYGSKYYILGIMCISLGPAEFKGTVIANFPGDPNNEQMRVLSYMNTVLSADTSSLHGVANTGPNAMIFPVYGEVTDVLNCDNPGASREWLSNRNGIYVESWEDESATRSGSTDTRARVAGNYLVRVANDIEDIPRALSQLKRETPFPDHVPPVSDYVLEAADRFYRSQDLGIPQFVIAAFALPPHHVDHKNPVTVAYAQSESVADRAVFPALDYHGHGDFQEYVKRDHRLLLSTNALNELFRSLMVDKSDTVTPPEFANAPKQFPVAVYDQRNPRNEPNAKAPNNDYIFDVGAIHAKLQDAQLEIQALADVDTSTFLVNYRRQEKVARIVLGRLGRYGVMDHSNQPETTAQNFAESGYGEAFIAGNLTQDEIDR
jgi:hypothetical protein